MTCSRIRSTQLIAIFAILSVSDALAANPNIILILADDMGYGDLQTLNKASTIPTPNLNSLAADGMTFTDAHSPSAVCTPTRYATLTGRYCWRSRLKRGVLGGYSEPLLEPGRANDRQYAEVEEVTAPVPLENGILGMKLPMLNRRR